MSYIDDIASTLRQAGVDPGVDAGSAVRLGWDYCIPGEALTDGRGAARAPHDFTAALPHGAKWIVHSTMTPAQLAGGYWRQCLIRPGDPRVPPGPDAFKVSSLAAHCERDQHMIALIGHTPADLALYLDHIRHTDPKLFAMLLTKRFKDVIAYRPRIFRDEWPQTVSQRCFGTKADYLPPFLALVLYAELARLAMNQAGLLALSFDDGVELTTTQFLERVPLAGTDYAPPAVMRAIEMLPFQSVALTGPDVVFANRDAEVGRAWATSGAARIALAAAETDGLPLGSFAPGAAQAIAATYVASPNYFLEPRRGHGSSRQPRPAATLWGLNRIRHAAVGMLEIMLAAQAWNERYRPNGVRLAKLPKGRRARAMATIVFGWLAETDPKAALAALIKMNGDEAGLTADPVTPLSIDLFMGGRSGDSLFTLAEEQVVSRPKPGEFGYTARYVSHLWFDARGDDIGHYRRFQIDAVREHNEAVLDNLPPALQDTARVPPEIVARLGREHGINRRHGAIGHNRPPPVMTLDPAAAKGAQLEGQRVSPLSTDHMLALLLRLDPST